MWRLPRTTPARHYHPHTPTQPEFKSKPCIARPGPRRERMRPVHTSFRDCSSVASLHPDAPTRSMKKELNDRTEPRQVTDQFMQTPTDTKYLSRNPVHRRPNDPITHRATSYLRALHQARHLAQYVSPSTPLDIPMLSHSGPLFYVASKSDEERSEVPKYRIDTLPATPANFWTVVTEHCSLCTIFDLLPKCESPIWPQVVHNSSPTGHGADSDTPCRYVPSTHSTDIRTISPHSFPTSDITASTQSTPPDLRITRSSTYDAVRPGCYIHNNKSIGDCSRPRGARHHP